MARHFHLKTFAAAGALALGFVVGNAQAALIVSSAIGGGALPGATLFNLDSCTAGNVDCQIGTLNVDVTGVGNNGSQFVTGPIAGIAAPPFLSGSNGTGFGNPGVPGPDQTQYVTSGIVPTGSITFTFDNGPQNYFGLLWGSVDHYNTLTFFNGATPLLTITGTTLLGITPGLVVNPPAPPSNQLINGTTYVNVTSNSPLTDFDKVVATSTQFAFEIDNIATGVPEPATLALLGAGLVGLGLIRRRKA